MALEDRYSPQSAPSPPAGVPPHSPHSSTTVATHSVLDMSLSSAHSPQQINDGNAIAMTMLHSPIAAHHHIHYQHPSSASALSSYQYNAQQLQHLHDLQQLQQLQQQQQQQLSAYPTSAFEPQHHLHHQHPMLNHPMHHRLSSPDCSQSMVSSTSTSATPDTPITIKEEEIDSVLGDSSTEPDRNANEVEDEDDDVDNDADDSDINVADDIDEEDPQERHRHQQQQQQHQSARKPAISFSISNILSDRFGTSGGSNSSAQEDTAQPHKPATTTTTTTPIFRPFEAPIITTPSAFTRFPTIPLDILEFSRQQQRKQQQAAAAAAAAAAAMMVERANFLNCFNPAKYPRIHEEIMRCTANKRNAQMTAAKNAKVQKMEKSEKSSSLGSLSKTISQIGKPIFSAQQQQSSCMSSPPPASNASSSAMSSSSSSSSSSASSSSLASLSSLSTSSSSSTCSSASSPAKGAPIPTTSRQQSQCKGGSDSGATNCSSPQPIPAPPPSSSNVSHDSGISGMESCDDTRSESGSTKEESNQLWPAWVYCTRYSDRPSSGPRYRRPKQPKDKTQSDEKRPRTAFSSEQLARLKREFNENRYLTERRRQQLSSDLGLNEAQIKIWFQNKRAKIKKSSGSKNPLALQLMAQGLYNHTTVPLTKEEEELEMRMNGKL